jgi:hypothetical protein
MYSNTALGTVERGRKCKTGCALSALYEKVKIYIIKYIISNVGWVVIICSC